MFCRESVSMTDTLIYSILHVAVHSILLLQLVLKGNSTNLHIKVCLQVLGSKITLCENSFIIVLSSDKIKIIIIKIKKMFQFQKHSWLIVHGSSCIVGNVGRKNVLNKKCFSGSAASILINYWKRPSLVWHCSRSVLLNLWSKLLY